MNLKDKNGDFRLVYLGILLSVILSASVFAILAFPGALAPNTKLVSQACTTEVASGVSEGFTTACTATTTIDLNDAVTQTATTSGNNQFMGIRTQTYNSTVTNCGGITNVKLCYEWWSSSASIGTCSVKVDQHNGGSYATASSTCPGTTANPGEICTDVTSLEAWTCDNFFTGSGVRALAYLQVMATTGGAKTLTVDDLYFNVTYVSDATAPVVSITYPGNNTYSSVVTTFNTTASDTNLGSCWYSFNAGVTNTTFSCNTNVLSLSSSIGSNSWKVWANDTFGNVGSTSVSFVYNPSPTITNISIVPDPSGTSAALTIRGNNVSDLNSDSLSFFCSESASSPTDNSLCSGGGNLTGISTPYYPACIYNHNHIAGNYTVYCRLYDGISYSSSVNKIYQVIGDSLTTSVISVAGDITPSYFDTVNDAVTSILVSGNSGMSCRWSSSDLAYGSMSSACAVTGSTANCSINDVASQGLATRYVSCQDSYGNAQTASNNLNINFYLDYSAPTTSDNSISSVQAPGYSVTITESDNVDSDPKTYYCTDTTNTCIPTTSIDNGGLIAFSSSNRGANYLRYYSIDAAGNTQITQSKTININQLPTFSSASDNAVTIKGGTTVTVSSVSSDADSGQTMKLYVCSSSGATASGCTSGTYCSAVGTANLSCGFASESDSASHIWYAYIYDSLNEAASANPLTGSYTTDLTAPRITIVSPTNTSYTGNSVSAEVITSEAANSVWYNFDSNPTTNVTMSNFSSTQWAATISGLSLGSHHIIFYANDSFGNFENSSTVYFIRVSPADSTPPAITINSPSNSSYQNPSSVLINITSNENLNWAGYQLNSGSIINLSTSSLTNWEVTLSGLDQESVYNLTVYANDSSSNQNNKSIFFYTDSAAPRYSSLAVSPNPSNQSQNVNCSIVWSDGFNINSVIISENSLGSYENHSIAFSGSSGSASYLISGTKLANAGTYSCIFYATDAAGNVNSTSQSFTVNDVVAPILTVTSPSNATYNQQTISLSLTSSENTNSAWYSLNGAANVAMSGSGTSWSGTLTGLTNGQYSIIFYANDSSNNIGSSSLIYFSVNTGATDSIAPVIFSNTIANASYIIATALSFNISSNENLNWSGYTLNGGSLTDLSNISSVLWNGSLSGLVAESINALVIYGNDSNNNQGSTMITFFSDNVSPRFVNVSVIPNPANETQNVICNAYVDETFSLASVKIGENASISGSFLNHTIDLASKGYANYTISNAQKGNFACVFYTTDAAGNVNSTTQAFTVNDVVAPIITINSPLNFTYTSDQIVFGITTSENATSANYSLDGGITNISMSGAGMSWSASSVITSDGSKSVNFYAADSSGNVGISSRVFGIDTSVNDITPPLITLWSPISGKYYTSPSILFNITSNENLSWAGFTNNSGPFRNIGNISTTNWNSTIVFAEGTQVLAFYANDTSSNRNQGNKNITIYIDLNNPAVNSFVCSPNPANNHQEIVCSASVSDSLGLDYAIVEFNSSSGIWQNSSNIYLSGTSDSFSFNISSENTSIGSFVSKLNVYDLSGRVNDSKQTMVSVLDDTFPVISNISYAPTSADSLDPNVNVTVNATIIEDYSIGNVYLMYKESLASSWSLILMSNISNDYNATFVPTNGTWQFKINATDIQGNQNVSSPTTLIVTTENSFYNSTNIPDVKSITYAQRTVNNSLGYVHIANTGDNALNFTLSITSLEIADRFDINGSLDNNLTFELASGTDANLTVLVNTTSLTAGLYDYSLSLSSAIGTALFAKKLYIQSENAPYLVTSITQYSSAVTKGQSYSLSAKVTNFGTQEATSVSLNWTLPSEFTVSSGSPSKYLSSLGIGEVQSAVIEPVISVSASSEEKYVNITANATASNANSSSDSRQVVIGSPSLVVREVSSGGGGTPGFANSGGGQSVVYTKEIEVVRGDKNQFEIPVRNGYYGTVMKDLTISISGFLEQYISISPDKIGQLAYNQTGAFTVSLLAPSYKDYEVHDIKITIKGNLISDNRSNDYTETQYVKLVIQEVSREDAESGLDEAKKAIQEMKDKNFSTAEMEKLLLDADKWLNKDRRYKNSLDISNEILNIRDTAYEADDLLRRVISSMQNPKKSSLLVGNVVKEFMDYDKTSSLSSMITGRAIFASSSIENVISLGVAAFERGDYNSALNRAKEARNLLVLERKGNFLLFVYLYWHYILFAIVLVSGTGILGYSSYQRLNISQKIGDLNRKEDNVRILMAEAQKKYFSGKISNENYHSVMALNQNQLAKIKSERVRLGNLRVKMLKPQELERDLEKERRDVESGVKKIQEKFYIDKSISDKEYGSDFNALNERLAEIEEEKTTLKLMEKKEAKHEVKVESVGKKSGIFDKIKKLFEGRKYKDEKVLKDKIAKMLEGKK